jgi:hypothetical protein
VSVYCRMSGKVFIVTTEWHPMKDSVDYRYICVSTKMKASDHADIDRGRFIIYSFKKLARPTSVCCV